EKEAFPRRRTGEETEAYLRSPVHFLRSSAAPALRRRVDTGEAPQFVLLEELRDAGMTEYAARIVPFGGADTASLKRRPLLVGEAAFDTLPGLLFSFAK